jgi:molecular chaperone DnaK (HSP70)
MVVDCGGGTVDLTCHEILANDRIGEITESKGGNCGSSFVDRRFIEFLGIQLGKSTIELLKEKYYNSLYHMVQEFCEHVKLPFTGQRSDFRNYEIDLEEYRLKHPLHLKDIIEEGNEKKLLRDNDWIITLKFDDVKKMFDPLITKIISLIKGQLDQLRNKNKKCSAMMLVGGFSESRYLQDRVRSEFNRIVPKISVPTLPITAVIKGGLQFGLKVESVVKRVLKRTYGIPITHIYF